MFRPSFFMHEFIKSLMYLIKDREKEHLKKVILKKAFKIITVITCHTSFRFLHCPYGK